MDAWDGDTDKLSAQDFLRAFHRDTRPSTSGADKAKAFKNYLVAGSEVDTWYKSLSAAIRADMDLLDTAIEDRYPSQETVQPTAAEYGVMLVKEKLRMEELGTKVKVADRDVWAHHAWANKMLRFATNAGVEKTSIYIEQVRLELPRQIRTKLLKTFKDWPEFIKAVRDVDTVELEVEMKEWREEKEKQDRVEKLLERRQALQASPTAGIRAQLTNTTIGVPAPRWPAPSGGANPFHSTGSGGQGNLFAPPVRQQPAPFQPRQFEQQAPLEGQARAILLAAITAIVHHPDTDAGHRAHADQQQAWFRVHGNVPVSVNTPYPLKPGRAPVNSGECFRCGVLGHTNFRRACTAIPEQCVSLREQNWRRIAAAALKEPAVAVRAVGYSVWDYDDSGRPFGGEEGRFEEVDDQGNA